MDRHFFCLYFFGNLKELFNDTILLNTRFSGVESLISIQKNPFLTNWKLSPPLQSAKLSSTKHFLTVKEFGFKLSSPVSLLYTPFSSSTRFSYNLTSASFAHAADTQ